MFDNRDFYPTNKDTARIMIEMLSEDWKRRYKYILEPSCGKGDLIQHYKEFYEEGRDFKGFWVSGSNSKDLKFDAVEIDDRLVDILRGKEINVVDRDFLNHEPKRYYDLILANFPFSNGVKHFLKAIEIQARVGGDIIGIVNAETIKNTYSNDRVYLKQLLDKYNADIRFVENSFIDAERSTEVEVAIIFVQIPMVKTESMFEREFKRDNPNINFDEFKGVATKMNKLQQLVFEYDMVIKSVTKLFEEEMRINKLLKGFGLNSGVSICNDLSHPSRCSINDFIEETNQTFWNKFITETSFETRLPSKLKNNFRANMQRQRNISFSMENVQYFYNELVKSIPQSYEETIGDLFDKITREYNYTPSEFNKNIHYYNSWKTNNAYAIGKKVIIPCSLSNPNYYSYSLPEELLDLNIAFNNITGIRNDDELRQNGEIYNAIKNVGKKIETSHFLLSSYKRGSLHIVFKDPKAVAVFNLLGAKGKNWVNGDFDKKSYSDMTEQEKEIVKTMGFAPMDFNVYIGQQKDYLRLLG